MNITQTNLSGCFVYEPQIFEDNRGYFFESFNYTKIKRFLPDNTVFVQDNESFSAKGVLRGLHYQIGEYAQAKLVRVVQGKILDVAVDLRKNSKTFLKSFAIELNDQNKKQLFIPRGCAHGFLVLSETAILSYKCDNYYNHEYERGIIFNDKNLAIDWKLPSSELIISEKDMNLPTFENAEI